MNKGITRETQQRVRSKAELVSYHHQQQQQRHNNEYGALII
jgi:hypothetical protein